MTAHPPYPDTDTIFAALEDPADENPLRQAVASRVGMLAVRLSATIIANRSVPKQFKIPKPITSLDRVATALFIQIVESNPTNPRVIVEDDSIV